MHSSSGAEVLQLLPTCKVCGKPLQYRSYTNHAPPSYIPPTWCPMHGYVWSTENNAIGVYHADAIPTDR